MDKQCDKPDPGIEIRVKGRVQGVGFRPYIWQIAQELAAVGHVLNDSKGVLIRLAPTTDVALFLQLIRDRCPPLAFIESVETAVYHWLEIPHGFEIIASQQVEMETQIIPDAATCKACQQELFDRHDRRYRYPFINCTHCGPRFTIISAMPYDRPSTTMAGFPLCDCCLTEYKNPANRRFHAQPVACPVCGPVMWLIDQQGDQHTEDALLLAAQAIEQGKIVAMKGLGGFHLVCDAGSDQAVSKLRERKRRLTKPLAVMVPDLAWASQIAEMNEHQTALLVSSAAPIVLVTKNKQSVDYISSQIAPGLVEVGLMLPANPLQHLLAKQLAIPVVMTSANATGYPPAMTNQQALSQLSEIADLFLLNNRPIIQRADDSLVRVNGQNQLEMLRRSRGYVPNAVPVPDDFPSVNKILAAGGDLKNSFAFGRDNDVIVSQFFGDLEQIEIQQQYLQSLDHFTEVYNWQPERLVIDCHPYYSTRLLIQAHYPEVPVSQVFHHHAHVAACLFEHGWTLSDGKVLALALDGIGVGPNKALWGGEVLLADYQDCHKLGGLPECPLPGGDMAAKQPWRILLSQLETFIPEWQEHIGITLFQDKPWPLLLKVIQQKTYAPATSSAGRLFDGVAASLGICFDQINYEGEAACQLESLAWQADTFRLNEQLDIPLNNKGNSLNLNVFWLQWFKLNCSKEQKAWLFHDALARAFVKLVLMKSREHNITTLVLTGGVFHNRLLTKLVMSHFDNRLNILQPSLFSCGDGGLALGQIAIAAVDNNRSSCSL
ncbi:carbamoyltransferase HypF [Photobacterium sp.]|uniref:carbamoyltransferase HypF n=1 Tax=Photobacterium sp. TaxID=660 RepID=UPI00299D51F2|nr:carbamoyltransferase HypF [Photobacterium sp.]MDX1303318.1 carbamoyltransferase HypF [Photobacterium sp.]